MSSGRTLLMLAVTAGSLLPGCTSRDEGRHPVRLWALAPPETVLAEDAGPAPLRLAIQLSLSVGLDYPAFRDLTEALGRRLGVPVRPILRWSAAEIAELLRGGEADAAFPEPPLPPGESLRPRLVPVAIPVAGGSTLSRAHLVVAAGADDSRQGEVVAVAGPTLVGRDQPWRPEPGPGRARRLLSVTGHQVAVRAVADGLVDAALVDGLAFSRLGAVQPGLVGRVRILESSRAEPNPPVAIHAALPPALQAAFGAALLDLHRDGPGRAALARLGLQRFVAPVAARRRMPPR